jgi:hypothetical protein
MTNIPFTLPADYWQTLEITRQDVEFLHQTLFENETPMTAAELAGLLIERRIRFEQEVQQKDKQAGGKLYLPGEKYSAGDDLVFPALDWKRGHVAAVRPGANPDAGPFDVLTVDFDEGGQRLFAASLAEHALNEVPDEPVVDASVDPAAIQRAWGRSIEKKLEAALGADDNLVRIAGRWFPGALLLDINAGQLNLAEAVLDMAGGAPFTAADLIREIDLSSADNPKLVEFSLNYALQEDPRFDEVGPAGQVLWCLERLEPAEVREIPAPLQYTPIQHDRDVLTPDMLALEARIDDELSDVQPELHGDVNEAVVSLIYPHWRAGTLPLSSRVSALLPTAYETPRVRFTLVDGRTNEKMSAWVVRNRGYVLGLRDWYKAQEMMPGSQVRLRRGKQPGEVIVEPINHRNTRDWVRTVIVGADGGMVFAMLKQVVTCDFNDRMAIAVPDVNALDLAWEKMSKNRPSFEYILTNMMREMTKLTPQGHVHAQELYSGINLIRRCPPAPILSLLATKPIFHHVGDLHFRLDDSAGEV